MKKEHEVRRPISSDEVILERAERLLSNEHFGPVEFKKLLEGILRMAENQNFSEQTIDLLGHSARFVEDEVWGKAYGLYRIGSQMAVDIVPLEVLMKDTEVNEGQNSIDVSGPLFLEKVRTTFKLPFVPAVVAEYIFLRPEMHTIVPFATNDSITVRAKKVEQRTLTDKQQKRLAVNIFSAWHVQSLQ